LGNIVKDTIKYALTSNIVTLEDLLYDKSFIKCVKTGAACTTVCNYFNTDQICKNAKVESRYLTAGQIWFLLQIAEDRIIDDRDFDAILHTGKSIKNASKSKATGTVTKRVRKQKEEVVTNTNDSKSKKQTKQKNIKSKSAITTVKEIILNYKEENRVKSEEWMSKALEKSGENTPDHVFNIFQHIVDDDKLFNDFKLNDYITLLTSYIKGTTEFKQNELQSIIDYMLFDYEKKSYDFPLNKNIDSSKIGDLYEKTSYLKDGHPEKWTDERFKKMSAENDEYLKTIYYDSEFYSWYLFGVLEEKNKKYEDITNLCIYTRYILRQLLFKFKYYYSTNEIILSNLCTDEILDRMKTVFKIIKDIYEKNVHNDIEFLFIKEQLDNLYVIVDNSKEFLKLSSKFKTEIRKNDFTKIVGSIIPEKCFKHIKLFN